MSHAVVRFAACLLLMGVLGASDQVDPPWPLDIPVTSGVITLYQPQPERLKGNQLSGRAAASYLATGKGEGDRVFGALWLSATLDIDAEQHVAKARTVTITKVITAAGEKTGNDGDAIKQAIQDAVLAQGFEIDLDRLAATLEEPGGDDRSDLARMVPHILIRQEPAVLVVLDGAPQVRDAGDLKRVVNSPAFIVIDSSGVYWLRGANDWLTAPALTGPWTVPQNSPPGNLVAAAKAAGYPTTIARTADAKAPEVIIAQEASELVVFAGKPAFAPIGDGALLGATNTNTPMLVEISTGQHWVLLAGRWYHTKTLTDDAAWELAMPDELPAAFATIPEKSEWDDLRAHVPGTPEADEAVAQQQIPQTARIPRTASITVTFDGDPRWVGIGGRSVDYAENTADAVFRTGGQFYACRDGVWYQGTDPLKPLAVATSIPDGLRNLPADCPWSTCSYVQIYESTPEYVWCGYTPGYLGYYNWYGCPVYGTGYPYPGWYGPALYYPRPLTWGVGLTWNAQTGWGATVGVGGAHWSVGIAVGGNNGHNNGWYGCGGAAVINHNTVNIDRSTTINGGDRVASRPALYDRVPGAERPALKDAANRQRPAAGTQPAQRPARENLAVDRDGTIGRPAKDGNWQVRDNGAWKDRAPEATPVQRPKPEVKPTPRPEAKPVQRPETKPAPSYERTQQMRNRGEQRVQQRSAPPAPARGGGGRRR
jgi:hypothetical protein